MAGKHIFSSSKWIQSGSTAEFKNGISVTGTVQATSFVGDGSGITGIGSAVFFAGSGSGISASSPSSVDHVLILNADGANADTNLFKIETTSSGQFKPNHFVFVKLTNKFETLQQGSKNFYTASYTGRLNDPSGLDPFNNDLAAGVHRYIVYATDTGSSGDTHAVYTSAFIKGYVNVPPTIIAPNQQSAVVQVGHDENTLVHVINLTSSFDSNQKDFIRIFSASRLNTDITNINASDAAYELTINHPQDDINSSTSFIATGSFDYTTDSYPEVPGAGPALTIGIPTSSLVFSASISNYTTVTDRIVHSSTVNPSTQTFNIIMMDNWFLDHSSSLDYSMSIVPPNTASINNIRLEFESRSYSGAGTSSYETTVLYDDIITRDNIEGLHDRYTSSLVRVAVMADITEPADYNPDPLHFTTVRIFSGSDDHIDRAGSDFRRHFQLFRFSGSTTTGLFRATASTFLAPGDDLLLSNIEGYSPTHSLGFTAFALTPQTFNYGFSGQEQDLANTNLITHGDHQHFSAHTGSIASLIINPVPPIEISNVRVEVESGSFLTHEGAFERTASVLYGYESTLLASEISSLEGYEKSKEYISESVVRIRLLATITEPFGPHHTNMQSTLFCSDGEGGLHQHTFAFHTGSEETASSAIAYDDQNRLVANYTSSFINFNLAPGVYNFNTSFTSNTNTGRIAVGQPKHASVSVSATPPTQITNIVYETETFGYSETGSTDTMRTVLYGVPRHTLINSSSFQTHVSASIYASHSVTRFRVLADIREPFGPHHTASQFEKVWTNNSGDAETFNSLIHFSTGSTDTASSAIAYDSANRLFARYTSSWIGQQLSSSNNASKTWTYTSGSIIHTPDGPSGFITASGQSTQLVINDTAQIQLTNRIIEFEEHGYSASNAVGSTGVTETSRTVLYGDNHRILGASSSFADHIKADQYASQSVLRYRVKFKVTEPVGPAVGSITIPIQRGITTISPTEAAHTGSSDFLFISSVYNSQKRLVTDYTSSWQDANNNQLAVSNRGGSEDFTYQVKDDNVVSSLNDENGINIADQQVGTVTVHDTAPTQITNVQYETETFGYSNEPSIKTTRKVLYGVAHKTNKDSSSYANHDSASLYASQSVTRFRVLATVTEPIGPLHTASRFEKVWSAPNEGILTDVIHFSSASADTASSTIDYNTSNQLVSHYTSSWIGKELTSNNYTTGEQWKYTSGSILHTPINENGFTTASGDSTTITVFDTQPTVFSNFKTETETFGYSDEPTQNTIRTVLYGNANVTNINSASFSTHTNSASYTSQSVSQFRMLATITEPVGPLQHTASQVERVFIYDNSVQSRNTITFGTASIGFRSSRSFFTPVGEFVTEYTTSFIGTALDVQAGASAERIWTISTGSVTHNPAGENSAISSSFSATTMKVRNTEQVKIEKIFWETETFGYSDVETSDTTRTVLYGNNKTTDINSSSYANHLNSASYSSQSVSRVRFRAQVTEPIGPAIDTFTVNFQYNGSDNFTNLHTGSIGTYGGVTSSAYENNRLVAHYTSSWIGVLYDVPAAGTRIHDLEGEFEQNIANENGIIQSDNTSGTITVIDTAPTQITNIRYETETFGYSNEPSIETTRKVLYGDIQVTNADTSSVYWKEYPSASLYASHSVTRFRILADITEPVGPLHTASRFEKVWTTPLRANISDVIHFSTNSIDIDNSSSIYNESNQLVSHYTSSWIGRVLSSSVYANDENENGETYTYGPGLILHNPDNETGVTTSNPITSQIIVYDTQPTQFNNLNLYTETFGYSNIDAPSGTRKVLYGVPHHTLEGTSSVIWASHASASLYASQSVSQFRLNVSITEPIGPLHTGSIIRQQFRASSISGQEDKIDTPLAIADITSTAIENNQDVFNAFNGSSGNGYDAGTDEILDIIFNNPQQISRIEINSQETIESDIEVLASPDNGITYFGLGDIVNNSVTPDRAYRYFKIKFNNRNNITVNEIEFFSVSSLYDILYNNTTFERNIDAPHIIQSKSFWDIESRLVTQYTASYFGVELSSSRIDLGETWQYSVSEINHSPNDLSPIIQLTEPNIVNMIVYDTQAPRYDNTRVESETYGYSDEPSTNTIRTVLYGNNQTTDIDSSSYANHVSASVYASHSVSRFRLHTKITEPVGPLVHTGSNLDMRFQTINQVSSGEDTATKTITFGTGSDFLEKSYWLSSGEFVAEYTSSYVSQSLTSGDTKTNYQISIQPIITQIPGENASVIANQTQTNMLVHNTIPTQIDSIAYETETHGLSNTASFATVRQVLYNEGERTNDSSASFAGHINAETYASYSISQFRVKARVTEPVGPLHATSSFERYWYRSPLPPGIPIYGEIFDYLYFCTSSNNVTSKSYSDESGRFIVEYTSSFAGQQLSASNNTTQTWIYTSGSILHIPLGENGFTTASGKSSEITVHGIPATEIKNISIEAETYGHSGIGVQNTTVNSAYAVSRSILYGETTSFANSGSFEGLNSVFAENSVTRFRILANVIEPMGPLHTGSMIFYKKDASVEVNTGVGDGEVITFSTSSNQTSSANIEYDSLTRLIGSYTSSWIEETLSPSRVLTDGYWHIDVDTVNDVKHSNNSNVNIDSSINDLYLVVSASKPLEIGVQYRVETFYSSSTDTTSRSENILYGFNRTLSASDANTIGDIWSGSAAVRLRPYAKIIEPLGFRHFTTEVTMSEAGVGERGYKFHTASLETASRSERVLNSEGRHVTSYTGSYEDGFTFAQGFYLFGASAALTRTGSDATGIYMDSDGKTDFSISSNQAQISMIETPPTEITNLRIEAETFSGSAVGTDSRTTTILHGNTVTETDKENNAGYPTETARQQLTSVRLLADIAEPFGPHHTASIFTISGYDSSHTVRLHTGSADISSSTVQIYNTHGSASIAYTSSFVPLQLTTGIKDLNISAEVHEFENNKNVTPLTHASITVNTAPTASVFTSPNTGSVYWSSSVDIDKYVTYNKIENLVVGIISGISASAPTNTSESILKFPQHLNIRYDNDNIIGLSFSTVNATNSGQETGSLTIANSLMNTLTSVTPYTVFVSGSDKLPGNGSSSNQPLAFNIIPAKPQTMHGMYWGTTDIDSHETHSIAYRQPGVSVPSINGNRQLYKGSLAEMGVSKYGPGDASGDIVSNIVMAKDTANGPVNYSMSFAPFVPSNQGPYSNSNQLFDNGDIGSLIVKINGYKVVDYNLQSNFDSDKKDNKQDIANDYDGHGTASFTDAYDELASPYVDRGKLIITHVEPFNNVHQNIFNEDVHYPNGYQGWSARIEIDNKLNDGYNRLEFSHSINATVTQSWQTFDWYYDDGIAKPQFRANATASYEIISTDPVFTLSGVSFFKPDIEFKSIFKDAISNLAAQSLRSVDADIMRTQESPSSGLTISTDDSDSGTLNHELLNTNTNEGLHFGTDTDDIRPTVGQSGSLIINVQASSISNAATGDERFIKISQYHRNYDNPDSWTLQSNGIGFTDLISLGRFANETLTLSTDLVESFFEESYRYNKNTIEVNRNIENGDYWIDKANADFDSTLNILNTEDLQVTHDGNLLYPNILYPGILPNVIDYRSTSGDRYFYRAFDIGSSTDNVSALKITITFDSNNPLDLNDLFAGEEIQLNNNELSIFEPNTTDFNATPIRIDVCLPGPIAAGASNTFPQPGTAWGCMTAATYDGSPAEVTGLDDWNTLSIGDARYTVIQPNQSIASGDVFQSPVTTNSNELAILVGLGSINVQRTFGKVLCKVRFKDTATNNRHVIQGLKIEPL